jgi:outer membrane lipoprotein-sorting protein
MQAILKVAAALLVAAGGLAYFVGFYSPGATLAFDEVARPLSEATSLSYTMTTQVSGVKDPISLRVLFKAPNLVRSERPGESAVVADVKNYKMLVLDLKNKTALLQEGKLGDEKDAGESSPVRMLEELRKLVEKEGKPAGKKRIGDVEAQGFLVKSKGHEMTVWADPKSKRPLRIEMSVRVSDLEAQIVLSDFRLNPKLDDDLFRLTPPEGYRLEKIKTEAGKPDEDVAKLLRMYADKSGGTFPKRFDDWPDYDKVLGTKDWKPTDPQAARLIQLLVRINLFLLRHKMDYGYKADGVKLGDANKIIFWYKPEGGEKYRAIYGDLHAADVTADQLPERPK